MKKNTPLDYAEFLLTHSCTRCELHICANGVKEKLASGYLKPFVTHLREAEAQVAEGNQVIRLERPSNFLKKNKVTWFTKGTLERFVRFVSTPEVLELVKTIDDELSQLEHVRVALSKTSPQFEDPFYFMDTTSAGVHKAKGNHPMKNKRSLMGTEDNGADGSKIELLKAMDVRLVALKQEQSDAFSRAMAAGFDSSNMADLLDFSEHFGAERLGEACIQFIGLFRRRNIAQGIAGGDSPSADAASSDSDMSLESCTDVEPLADIGKHCLVGNEGDWSKTLKNSALDYAGKLETKEERKILASNSSARTRSRWGPPERLQINHLVPEVQDSEVPRKKGEAKHQLGNYNQQDDITDSVSGWAAFEAGGEFQTTSHLEEQPKRSSLIDRSVPSGGNGLQGMQQGEGNIRAGMFFNRLHKMAQQVEARRSSEDLGVHFTSIERSVELSGSQLSGYGHLCSVNDSIVNSPLSVVSDAAAMWQSEQEDKPVPAQFSQGGTSSLLEDTSKVVGNSVTMSVLDHVATEDGDLNRHSSLEKCGDLNSATSESNEVKESQEEPTSTSARRLSVKAAISLFEGKKATVGEPPTRNLARQDSQKAVLQSGSSAAEKSVLRRWSGLAHDGTSSKHEIVTEVSEKRLEKGAVTENAAGEIFAKQDSPSSSGLPQSAIDLSSSRASQSAQRTVLGEASLWKSSLSTQRQSSVEILTEAPWEVLPKQASQEPEIFFASRGSPSNLTNAVLSLPTKSLADILKPSEVTSRSAPGNRDIKRTPVRKEMVDVQVDLGVQSTQNFNEPKRPGSLSIHYTAPKRPPNHKEDKVNVLFVENLEVDSLKHKAGKSRLAETNSWEKIISEPDKEPSSILHETPVDLYMQALVMIIDNHNRSAPSLGNEESGKEERGRLYDRYWQLRNARQKGENPAKRAEREAKLKSMQEVLERRKTEMETGIFRQMKSSRRTGKEQEGIAQPVKMSGPLLIPQEKEMGEAEVVGQQDGLGLASSQAQAMSITKVQPVRKVAPKLQKSASTSRSLLMTASMVSPKTMPKSLSGTGASVNQCKMATSSCNVAVDNSLYRNPPVGTSGGARRSTSVCTELSEKSHGNTNGYSQFPNSAFFENDSAADVFSKTADTDLSCQRSAAGKDWSFSSDGGRLCGQAQHRISLEAHKGNVDSDAIACVNEESLSIAQNAKPFLCQGHDNFLIPVNGLTRHEIVHHKYPDEQCSSGFDDLENGTTFLSWRREAAEGLDVGESIEASIVKHAVKDSFLMHPEKPRSNAVKSMSSIQKPLKFLKEASAGHIVENASNNEKLPFIDQVGQETSECNLQRGRVQLINGYEESSALIPGERLIKLSQNYSTCSPLLQQDCTASVSSGAAASPVNSLETSSGTVLGAYSPELSISSYSPSVSPASRSILKAKNFLEHGRHSSLPQSSKEPARGFKRLLHFGRKNRTSEAVTSDGVSVSTASEGDDETEEVREPMRHLPSENFRRVNSQEKGRQMGSTKGYSGFQDQRTTHSLQSNIPIPPSNLKLRDDRFLGGSSLKASRSFFSLSSFRSKGTEGKSR